ncbi:OmpA family protein [Sulfurimonas sp. SAG-AH-194-C21]|nr:OmpA family protein [Sulfurimonas sp. SAG-AH-194-C21]MDF1884311.1 OmpA family protein [Sulfurimonas sp. SAG-AH-194-C21]
MMSGLMLVFLFIAISFMVKVEAEKQEVIDIAIEYRDTKANINEALYEEFENDLENWNATITQDNSMVFSSEQVLFEVSESKINPAFKAILKEFFSRYIKILTQEKYKDEILELRVEGHTSDTWENATSKEEIYLKNMQLSQERAYEVLSYCYSLDEDVIKSNRPWLEKYFRANGMAFSKLKELEKSRRVEFTIVMKSEDSVYKILK